MPSSSRTRWHVASPYLVHHVQQRGSARPGHRIERNSFDRAFVEARDKAGIVAQEGRTPFTFHEIRSLSERLYRQDFGAEFAQSILGHKSAKTTERYDDLRGEWKVVEVA